MGIVDVRGLTKTYPAFRLSDVSFSLERGRIAGFIGRNGAGKTTTIKAMLNLVTPDAGEVSYFSLPLLAHEREIKGRIGYSGGTVSWYPRRKISEIARVTRSFYPSWDEGAYERYLHLFDLDQDKRPSELSEGMRVKLNLALALSHHAEVLVLDEPTSGLDPFSRDELLEVLRTLADEGATILFSTHITSDLERAAHDIIYISGGRVRAALPKEAFHDTFSKDLETLEETIVRLEREMSA